MKKKIFITTIILLLILTTSIVFIRKNKSVNATLDTVSLKEVEKNNMFAIMLQNDSGEYEVSNSNEWPEDYFYNEKLSGCMDNNGEKIENSLTYDSDSNKVTLTTNKTSYCYLYFDKNNAKELIEQLKKSSGLSINPVGGMYRYQGPDVDNYLCFEGKCSSQSDEMYRIIGITENGNIKVMKQTSIGNYAWNSNDSDSTCGTDGCPEWPESELYTTLNTTFYNSLNEEIKNKIEPQNWWYGDMHYDFVGTLSANEIYQVETGAKNTKYYGHKSSNTAEVTNESWTQMNEKANIGLIYLHDYYYQANEDGCHYAKGKDSYQKCKDNGWMHIKNNGITTSGNEAREQTMTRVGRGNYNSVLFWRWYVDTDGEITNGSLVGAIALRPVFYLKSNITLYGSGTVEDPYTLTEVIPTDQENTLRLEDTTDALSKTLVGGMYRYQGADELKENKVKNYICLKEVGTNGCDAKNNGYDDNMYRIIGITPEGNIKVIKQTKFTNNGTSTYAWSGRYDDSYCGSSGCPEWPRSDVYTTLNETFYKTLDSEIQGKIQKWNWYYGDMHYNFVGTLTANQIYQVESGDMNTKYYGPTTSDKKEVTGEKWTNTKEANIGLMYLHDYYYQANQDGCHNSKGADSYNKCRDSGWMHMYQNGNTSDYEWTMSRVGRRNDSLNFFDAWFVYVDGRVDTSTLERKVAVRPVFYLTNDIKLKGKGTTLEPFYIAN